MMNAECTDAIRQSVLLGTDSNLVLLGFKDMKWCYHDCEEGKALHDELIQLWGDALSCRNEKSRAQEDFEHIQWDVWVHILGNENYQLSTEEVLLMAELHDVNVVIGDRSVNRVLRGSNGCSQQTHFAH